MDLTRLRGRLPPIVFVVLVLFCLGLLGFACACLSDQPAQALERALQGPAMPALVEVWPLLALLLSVRVLLLVVLDVPARSRASPARLQRFLF